MIARLAAFSALSVALSGASPARADTGCGARVLFAQLAAVGRVHHLGEYLIQLTAPESTSGRPSSPVTVSMSAQDGNGSTTALRVDDVVLTTPLVEAGKTVAILAVVPSTDVRTFSVESVTAGGIVRPCAPAERYDLPMLYRTSKTTFDDDASWVKVDAPVVLLLDGPKWTSRGTPDASSFDSKFTDEADVYMTLVIDADGSLGDATIVRSSGQPGLDAASLGAARESRFSPAHLPSAYGGGPVTVETSVKYVFMSQ